MVGVKPEADAREMAMMEFAISPLRTGFATSASIKCTAMALFNRSQRGRWVRFPSALCALSLSLSLASPAAAEGAGEKAAAEALFDEGVRLLKDGKLDEACPKFERSQAVDPGIGTLLYLGECYRKQGRTASAWATFREAASKAEAAGEADRARAGAERADEIEPTLSRVLFSVDPENSKIEALQLNQGTTELNRALWGSAIPVDPGLLKITASAPGYESFEITVEVQKGPSERTVAIPALTKIPEETAAPSGTVEPAEEQPAHLQVAPEDLERPLSGQKTAGLVFGGVGLVGLGVGGVFGALAMVNERAAEDVCTGSVCAAGSDGVARTDKAQDFALVSTIGFVAGGALLATGAILYYTAPKGTQTATLQVIPTFGGAHISMGSTF